MVQQTLIAILALIGVCIPCVAGTFVPPLAMVPIPYHSSSLIVRGQIVGGPPSRISGSSFRNDPVAIPHFLSFRNKGRPTQRTEVKLAHDASYLYVIFICHEDNMPGLVAECSKHDGPVWRDDSVEIFLDPDNDGKNYYHLIANSTGAKYDEHERPGAASSWDGPWYADAKVKETEWQLVASIPFSSLGLKTPREGDVWSVNFGRNEKPHAEMSTWSPVVGEFAEPQHFGRIVFSQKKHPVINASIPDVGAPGDYLVTAKVSNPSSRPVALRADILVDGKPLGTSNKPLTCSAPMDDSKWEFGIEYPLEGRHTLSLQFTDSEGKIVMRTSQMAVDVPPLLSRLNRFRQIVREMKPSASLADDVASLRVKLAGLTAFERTAEGDAQKWAELGRRLDAVQPEVARLRYACADVEGCGYVTGTETSLTKILRDRFFDGEIGQPVRISAARNESESAQAIVIPHQTPLDGVEVSVSPLVGPAGTAISAVLNLVDYVQTRQPKYDIDYIGWWPDPLMPMKPFDVPKGTMQPIWITVRPSAQTPAGVYKGTVTVKPRNAPESVIPIEVRVWDFALPVEPHLKTAFALFEHEIGAWYGGMTEDIKRDYYAFMLDHRLSVMNLYSKQPLPRKEDMQFCFERGEGFLTLAYTHNKDQEGRDELAAMIREHKAFMEPEGWWDNACVYGFDEIKPDKYDELRDMYGWLKKEFPDLPRMCTVTPTDELKGSIDIWVPLTSNYVERDARELEKAGNQVWWYVCCVPYHPYPNFFIDYPAVDQRIIFWMNWKYKIPGFLYYAVNNWLTNRTARDLPEEHRSFDDPTDRDALNSGRRWPEIKWNTYTFDNYNGDGHLVYPGPGGKPISSVRLECIRDGIEDYDYFVILEELVGKAGPKTNKALIEQARRLLAISDELVGSPCDYTLDPMLILQTRQEVAETIEKLYH